MNPARQHRKLWATREGIASLDGELPADFPVEYADVADLARLVARDAPHQGLVLECQALEELLLAEVLDADPARPLVVLGDLNQGARRAARVSGWRPLAQVATFPAGEPTRQLDHVLVDGDVRPLAPAVALDTGMSDHRALLVDVAVNCPPIV